MNREKHVEVQKLKEQSKGERIERQIIQERNGWRNCSRKERRETVKRKKSIEGRERKSEKKKRVGQKGTKQEWKQGRKEVSWASLMGEVRKLKRVFI